MTQTMGICAIVPCGQRGLHPRTFGMAILVSDVDIVTCAHVIDHALDLGGRKPHAENKLFVYFPFSQECLEGVVDIARWYPPSIEKSLSDIAVIRLI